MSKKPLSDEQFRSSLLVGHFGRNAELPPPGDPVTVMVMRVEIGHIRVYDGNIRLVRNPKYDDLRHRILTLGQEGELPITRRPGAEHFMIAKGGNTTLEIMQELWQTGDGRFRAVDCRYYPWTCESDVLGATLAENEVRGENTFIEKALAVQKLRLLWAQETGAPLGLREFERRLRGSAGLSYSRRDILRFQYATETLYPLIPDMLIGGLGPWQADQIRKLETTYWNYWLKRRQGDVVQAAPPADQDDGGDDETRNAAFAALFGAALSRHDGPDMIIEVVRDELEKEIAAALELPLRTVRMDIDAIVAGVEFDIAPVTDADLPAGFAPTAPVGLLPEKRGGTPGHAGDPRDGAGGRAARTMPVPGRDEAGSAAAPPTAQPPASATASVVEQVLDEPHRGSSDVKSLRSRAYVLAWQLCQRHRLTGCVSAAPHWGVGFVVDLPERPLLPADDPVVGRLRYWVWCFLFAVTEQIGNAQRVRSLPTDNRLRALALGMAAEGRRGTEIKRAIFTQVADIPENWMHCDIHWQLLADPSIVDDRDLKDVLHLAQACRDLRKQSGENGDHTLWEEKEP